MLRTVLVWTAAIAFVTACERRVEEPSAPRRPGPTSPSQTGSPAGTASDGALSGASASAAAASGGKDPRLADRCVRPLPETPVRPLMPSPDPNCPPDPEPGRVGSLRLGAVHFSDAGASVAVELAEREPDQMRGLMYRRRLTDKQGMLFVFDVRDEHPFWMRNTCVPLDMLYIDADGLIEGIEENTRTLNDENYSVGCPVLFVLELAGGWSRRHNVKPGQFVRIEGL